jgi:hypothetical protein
MKAHLYSLHPSIWYVVELEMEILDSDNKGNPVEAEQIIHRNSQAATILFASLCRKEHNKMNDLESDKEIWDTLKMVHEGDKITKVELLARELSVGGLRLSKVLKNTD